MLNNKSLGVQNPIKKSVPVCNKMFWSIYHRYFFNHPLQDEMIMNSMMSWMVTVFCGALLFQHAFFNLMSVDLDRRRFIRGFPAEKTCNFPQEVHWRDFHCLPCFFTSDLNWWCHSQRCSNDNNNNSSDRGSLALNSRIVSYAKSIGWCIDSCSARRPKMLLQSCLHCGPFLAMSSRISKRTGGQTESDYRSDQHHKLYPSKS